jgi:hypothetical protein
VTHHEEDYIREKFVKNYFGKDIDSNRPYPNEHKKWPDGTILLEDGKRIALEITELLHTSNIYNTREKRLQEKENHLSSFIQEKIKNVLPTFGGSIHLDIDLEKLNIDTNGKARKIGEEMLCLIQPVLSELKAALMLSRKFDFRLRSNLLVYSGSHVFVQPVCQLLTSSRGSLEKREDQM